ncbi:Chromosomal replication initiator protein DnaA [Aedoeadaptatus ivorii]|uniref:Chromosomal replication initiator protein DnaA n=1 Tax=Aedoeadaptatus ivorii TaxID=54006 RepID=A0A3S4YN62_9FIRM|nr:chromosomal replication initiator protein DnaA [Peptoniphilus ivorii]MDQ0508423.1 chromosomal replication initiator protein [Peptoniphilus ivorii]VEJ34139.1 Chromosomal replication initiator protein DnaA [Peptoniphilus ivorii]
MIPDVHALWEKAFQYILEENLYESQINTWFRPIRPVRIQDDTLILGVSREFVLNHLQKNNNNYKNLIRRAVKEAAGSDLDIRFVLTEGGAPAEPQNDSIRPEYHLNPKYTFDSFVVGPSNQFAHAASLAVAENPRENRANPLFIYGGVGLGKTHLMHAIGHFLHRNDPSKRILYVTSEQFTNEFIASIQTNRNEEFRRKYRSQDLLLIDDIQFIADKESTMDEFFHTFNELHGRDKQIVMTSDKPPKDIQKLEQRLISRFAWGLVVDIQAPDLETRIAILRNKAESDGFDVPEGVINYIATHVKSNIRELEGALSRVTAYAKLTTGEITEETAAMVLKDIYENNKPVAVTVGRVKEIIAAEYHISLEDLNSKKRSRPIAYPRQIAMYLTRSMTDLSLPKIGQEFGGRDHSTVIHAYDKIEGEIESDPEVSMQIERLKEKIKGN